MNNEMNNEMMVVNKADLAGVSIMDSLNHSDTNFFCSIENDGSRAAAVKIYNAIQNAKEKLDDHKGEVLKIVNVVAHPVQLVDENTGEMVDCVRTVLIDENGVGYEAVSQGVVSSLVKLFGIVGRPTWEPALEMVAVEQKTRKGFKTLTIELV